MTGRRRLTWVTALTVASLLLGGGALNALAEGRGHGDGGQAKPEHQQKDKSAEGGEAAVVQLAPKVHPNPAHDSVKHKDEDNVNQNADVDRKNGGDDDEDLVTPPARVTNEERPGLGCGDKNKVHTGPPGNPDKHCKPHDDGDDDGATSDEASETTDDQAAPAVVDDGSGD